MESHTQVSYPLESHTQVSHPLESHIQVSHPLEGHTEPLLQEIHSLGSPTPTGDGHLRKYWVQVPDLVRHLSRDLIGAHGMLVGLLAKAKVEAGKDERKGDAKPHAEQGQHGGEGNGTR